MVLLNVFVQTLWLTLCRNHPLFSLYPHTSTILTWSTVLQRTCVLFLLALTNSLISVLTAMTHWQDTLLQKRSCFWKTELGMMPTFGTVVVWTFRIGLRFSYSRGDPIWSLHSSTLLHTKLCSTIICMWATMGSCRLLSIMCFRFWLEGCLPRSISTNTVSCGTPSAISG